MGVFTEDVSLNVENVEESQIYAVFEPVEYTAILGESAAIQVPEAINYIKSGQAEINEVVQARTQEFNQNAADKTNSFNQNATDKTNNFNLNTTNKTEDFNQNASDKTGDFNSNASDKTGDFNLNATSKTNDFNDNYVEKKGLIDAEVSEAEAFSDLAKQWAIGEPTEPTGHSAKYWANEAASELSGLTSRVSTIEGKIPSTATSSNQLTDKSYVDNMDIDLQRQIDALVVSSDVFDIVGTYADLQAYDISTVPVNDIIKVLVDSTHSGAATYYRCVESGGVKSWSYIGSEGAYYTKAEADSLFATPSDIGNATITITQGGVSKGTFTTNQSGNATIDVDAATIPSNMVTTDTAQTITAVKTFSSSPIVPTPATSDDSTNAASTAFVKAQGYALDSDVVKLSGNQSINDNKTFNGQTFFNSISGITFNISGTRYGFVRPTDSSGISRMSFDCVKIINDTTVFNGIDLNILTDGTKQALLSFHPDLTDSTKQIATTQFVKSVLSTSGNGLATYSQGESGYYQFTNGLMFQWGKISAASGDTKTVTFPQPFTSSNYFATCCINRSGTTSNGYQYCTSKTTTSCLFTCGTTETFWMAIGY